MDKRQAAIRLHIRGILKVASTSGQLSARAWAVTAALAVAIATGAPAQKAGPPAAAEAPNSASGLQLPENMQLFGTAMPSVVKATAIINGEVITQTDVDQRLALLVMANGDQVPP